MSSQKQKKTAGFAQALPPPDDPAEALPLRARFSIAFPCRYRLFRHPSAHAEKPEMHEISERAAKVAKARLYKHSQT